MTTPQLGSSRITGALLIIAVALSGACTYQRAYIAYDHHEGGLALASEALDGETLGTVAAAESGPVWKDCTEVAEAAVWVLIDEARRLGGNAIGDIRWFPAEPVARTDRPTCRQRWGWVLMWPVLATPAFQTARVEGVAYRLAGSHEAVSDLYVIPDTQADQEALVARIVNHAAADTN